MQLGFAHAGTRLSSAERDPSPAKAGSVPATPHQNPAAHTLLALQQQPFSPGFPAGEEDAPGHLAERDLYSAVEETQGLP